MNRKYVVNLIMNCLMLATLPCNNIAHASPTSVQCNSDEMPVPVTVKTSSGESSTMIQCSPALCMVRALHTVSRNGDESVRHISVFRTAGANKEELLSFDSKDVMEGMSRARAFVKEGKCTNTRLLPDER